MKPSVLILFGISVLQAVLATLVVTLPTYSSWLVVASMTLGSAAVLTMTTMLAGKWRRWLGLVSVLCIGLTLLVVVRLLVH